MEIRRGLRAILRNNGGDDWNDAPYEHNAGEPYDSWGELIEDNELVYKRKYIEHPIEIKVLYFETCDWSERRPCDGYCNSPYSVEYINKGKIAWLSTDKYSIQAGTSLKEFIDTIKKHGGKIYLEDK